MQSIVLNKSTVSTVVVHLDLPATVTTDLQVQKIMTNDLRATAVADFNGDGFQDILIHPSFFNSGVAQAATLLLNDGHGGFVYGTQQVFGANAPVFEQSNGVFVASFTNDGKLGMFVVDQGLEIGDSHVDGLKGGQNHYYQQDAKGVWKDLTDTLPDNKLAFNHVSSVVDVNGDGNLDMLVTRLGGPNFEGSGTFFYLGNGKGGFSQSTAGLPDEIAYQSKTEHQWSSTTIDYQFTGGMGSGDLNGDGKIDLIAGSYAQPDALSKTETVRVYTQDAAGRFNKVFQTAIPDALKAQAGELGVAGIQTGDIDGDGKADIVVRWENSGKSAVQILHNDGNSHFSDGTVDALGSYLVRDVFKDPNAQLAQSIDLTDVNHDGALDMVLHTFNSTASGIASGAASTAFTYLNDGTGKFTAEVWSDAAGTLSAAQIASLVGNAQFSLGEPVVMDVNSDGSSDTVFINPTLNADRTVNLNIATVYGIAASNIYHAADGGERLTGSAGNDIFIVGAGHDSLNGGGGVDTLVMAGSKAEYKITAGSGGFQITRGNDIDVVQNIERVQFTDTNVALDIGGTGGKIFRLYQAAFDRAPDLPGLGFWIRAADVGVNMNDIASGFTGSAEFARLYGADVSDGDYVTRLYNNVLHRDPEQAGFEFWTVALHNGVSRETLLSNFAESAENIAALVGVTRNGVEYTAFHG